MSVFNKQNINDLYILKQLFDKILASSEKELYQIDKIYDEKNETLRDIHFYIYDFILAQNDMFSYFSEQGILQNNDNQNFKENFYSFIIQNR